MSCVKGQTGSLLFISLVSVMVSRDVPAGATKGLGVTTSPLGYRRRDLGSPTFDPPGVSERFSQPS